MTGVKVRILAAALLGGAMVAAIPAANARTVVLGRDEVRADADCVVEQNRRLVVDLIMTLPGSADERHVAHRLNTIYGACFGGERRIDDDDLTGLREAFAVALVLADSPRAARVGEPWYRIATAGKRAYAAYDPRRLGTLEFGSCVMMAAPEAAVALVRAEPDSKAEQQAIIALRPAVGPCVTRDMTVRLKANDLRSLLAEPVYHATTS